MPNAPLASPQNPVVTPHQIRYLFTDLFGNLLAQMPMREVSFSKVLNNAGTLQGTLLLEDPIFQQVDWRSATSVNRACVWVEIDGALVWGGLIQRQDYARPAQTATIGANDFWSVMAQRLQAKDYATTWLTSTGAAQIAATVIGDALASANFIPILGVNTPVATPAQYQITYAAPITQRQTIAGLVQQLQQLGLNVGFDFSIDVQYVAGIPAATITLSYPRRGRIAGSTGLTIDLTDNMGMTYSVDGTRQATVVVEMATSAGGVASPFTWSPAMTQDGYPLLESVSMHSYTSTTVTPQPLLNAWGANDLMLAAYPIVTPQVTADLWGDPPIGSWIVGDDIRVIVPARDALQVPTNPRFPGGLDTFFRIVRADITIGDDGLSTVAFTLNMPPSSSPQRPPL